MTRHPTVLDDAAFAALVAGAFVVRNGLVIGALSAVTAFALLTA